MNKLYLPSDDIILQTLRNAIQEESQWPHWVVVFGFNPNVDHGSTSALQNILRLFQEFGEIDDYSVSPGNWLFIKYVLIFDVIQHCTIASD